jgi:UDP-N-acetylmuramate dehydrogenase
MEVIQPVSLLSYNSFGFDVEAEAMVIVHSEAETQEVARNTELALPLRALGGGSNVLLKGRVAGTVVLNRIEGIEQVAEDAEHVWIRAGAGVNWHQFVLDTLERELSGVENLSLIPGTVGASPIQNIGAYGVEVKDTVDTVRFMYWEDGRVEEFENAACRFGYRDSIFKHELKDKGMVTAVTFRLMKHARIQTSYGAIQQELEKEGVLTPTSRDVSNAVISIRRSKLPDPAVIGNAGSFFKNPTVPVAVFEKLKEAHPGIPSYPAGEGMVKVPAGWLIEQCGWKGATRGPAGVHDKQALVLVNRGGASGEEVWALSEEILKSVEERFGVMLEREVQVW